MRNQEKEPWFSLLKQDMHRRAEVGLLPHLLYRINISENSKSRINTIRRLLHTEKKISFVVYFNHISIPDPYFAMQIIEKIDPRHSRKIVAPASYYHTDPDNIKNEDYIKVINESVKCGVEIIRVIQMKDGLPMYGYSPEFASTVNRVFWKRLLDLGWAGIPSGVMISPEGTRSSDGILGNSEGGVSAVGRALGRINPVLYIPVAIKYNEPFDRNGLNVRKSIDLSVGTIFLQTNLKEQPQEDFLMYNLAAKLPSSLRGKWGGLNFG